MTADEVMRIGARVSWRRELYRVRYANRPIDTGTVVGIVDTPNLLGVKVRRDGDGQIVQGPWAAFVLVRDGR